MKIDFPVMGTHSSIVVPEPVVAQHGKPAVQGALDAARAALLADDRRFSHYRTDSEISLWAAGRAVAPDAVAEIEHVLRQCERLAGDSDGVFRMVNPRTGALDTAGYVKGYAIGKAADVLRSRGLDSFLVGVGGDVVCAGDTGTGPWQVAIADPRARFGVAAIVDATDLAVATSGTSERGDHIWREITGTADPDNGIASFTVIGPSIAEADAFATIGFAMGEAGQDWVARHDGYRSVVVRTDGTLVADAALVSAV